VFKLQNVSRIVVFVLLLMLIACAYALAQEAEIQTEVKAKPEYQAPLMEVLYAYTDIQKSHAVGYSKKHPEQATKLGELSLKYSEQFKEDIELAKLLLEMSRQSESLVKSKDCYEHSKEAFVKISNIAVTITKKYLQETEKKKFAVFHCSREDLKWVQNGHHTPRNPFHKKPYRNRRFGRTLGCDHPERDDCIKKEHKH
jgi:hypothetical protein